MTNADEIPALARNASRYRTWSANRYSMSGFPDWPNPMRSGAMQYAVGATRGMTFRHRYRRGRVPVQKKRDRCVRVSPFPKSYLKTKLIRYRRFKLRVRRLRWL